MKKLHFLFKLAFFWLVYFEMFRFVFMLTYMSRLSQGQFKNTLWAFVYGLRMDISATSYLVAVPLVLYLLMSLSGKRYFYKILNGFQAGAIAIITLLHVINIYTYSHWGSLLNARVLMYLGYPREVLASLNGKELVLILIFWLIASLFFYRIYRFLTAKSFLSAMNASSRTGKDQSTQFSRSSLFKAAGNLLFIPLLIIGMRGGLQFTPMNESITYYSVYPINNHIATNLFWYMGYTMLDMSDTRNPYLVMTDDRAKKLVHYMMEVPTDSTLEILNTRHPNVVVIMLESWTADVVKALGGDTATTPCFDTLRRHGLLFTRAYASGSRTEQGLASIISGFPAQPYRSIVSTPEKARKLPFITDAFYKAGYHFSYYYGGDADFANMKIYMLNAHFNKIVDKASFPSAQCNGGWGAHDAYVYNRQLHDMGTEQQPFFSLIMTLSSHEPFEVPTHKSFTGRNDVFERFRNAIYYSDQCLAKYLGEASRQKWFDSTLYILVADHGHHLPKDRYAYSPEAHRMTLMLYGGALKKEYQGKEITKATSQCDIAAILYSQLHLDHSAFKWSKDVLNPGVKDFACYVNDPEAGIVSGKQHLTYFLFNGKIRDFSIGDISADSLRDCARAWLQLYYQQYLNY